MENTISLKKTLLFLYSANIYWAPIMCQAVLDAGCSHVHRDTDPSEVGIINLIPKEDFCGY